MLHTVQFGPKTFFFNDEEMTEIVIGENLTSPPGYDQPSIFEPIERAMSHPAGRGVGTSRDDIYAMGVTIGILVLGQIGRASCRERV